MQERKKPKVSIVIALFNLEDLVLRALESIPKRDDIEIIVVDDCSTDNSLNVVLKFWADTDANMKVIRHKVNKGNGVAFNTAIDFCEGDYIYVFDPDDYLYTDEWEKALGYLDGTDIVYVDADINDGTVLTTDDGNHNRCAFWFKFIRREYLGAEKRVFNAYGGDYEMNIKLVSRPHTSKQTGLLVYHYNYPREGSVIWNLTHDI